MSDLTFYLAGLIFFLILGLKSRKEKKDLKQLIEAKKKCLLK